MNKLQMWCLSGLAGLALLVLTALAPPALATPYSQAINESGVGNFDNIQAFIVAPNTGLSLTSFSDGSWTATNHSPTWVEASGNTLNNITFTTGFDIQASFPVFYDFFAFLNGNIVDSARFTLSPALSVVDPLDDPGGTYALDVASATTRVPAPATIVLFGTALLGLWFFQRRRSSNGNLQAAAA